MPVSLVSCGADVDAVERSGTHMVCPLRVRRQGEALAREPRLQRRGVEAQLAHVARLPRAAALRVGDHHAPVAEEDKVRLERAPRVTTLQDLCGSHSRRFFGRW